MPAPDRLVQLGTIIKAHGIRGEIAVRADEDMLEDLLANETLFLRRPGEEARPVKVESARPVSGGALLHLQGIESRDQADALRGSEVMLPRSQLELTDEDEFLTGDLIGLRAVDPQGRELGRVHEIGGAGEVPVLMIRGRGELQVPLVDHFVKRVDLEAGEIVVAPPEEE
jgi:16S rRNA processing protein RimM